MKQYDYLIVGAGLFGSVFACEATKKGKKCLVIDRREHLGGNVYCENVEGIQVHKYGPHIFHTNDKKIWDYINQFADFNHFVYSPVANYKGKLYNLPFNMNTFYQLWGVTTPEQAKDIIHKQIQEEGIQEPKNLEEQALSLVGKDVYQILIKGYTEKQWGRKATELPPFIIKRLPVRYTFDNNYFNDRYQGIPIGGYNVIIDNMLKGIETRTGIDYLENKVYFDGLAQTIVYTGKIDEYFNYCFGELEYRSLRFETEILEEENFQGCAGVNYTDVNVPYTRIVEHKHFEFGRQKHTVVTREYSQKWDREKEAYYPVNDQVNQKLFSKYKEKAQELKNVIFGGRLAEYRYYDMHQVIASALHQIKILNL
ncbi:UDP-galactopyranose mutase [Capnocytophaga canis]|uniref:UDP-galactopyranose mutase, FAD/NAD(P)-binding n=1 Tax=Capnocytophaga canis TaxID=1848903 RepID=A0A0B7IS89_9FLAO|nr:UDP-galactopyranose mutase [Capnocytophaga canis]CEN52833.1 UDP-galactopyranose mutase, FAD/NAD(P)-binding [Capnocytophaga canis]